MDDEKNRQLVANYLKGDERSLEILIRRHLKPVYGFAYKYVGNFQDAEDITQEVFVKVWRNLKKFDGQRSFKAWIFSIAKNTTFDFLKKKKTVPFVEFENGRGENVLAETIGDSSFLPVGILERKDAIGALGKAILKLLPKYQKIIFLRHNDDLTFREISEKTGESLNTVKSRHRRGLIMLKKFLGE